jgi:hypothetical protein
MVFYNTDQAFRESTLKFGSKLFNVKNAQVASGSSVLIDYATDVPTSAKYLPFNLLIVTNNGEDEITIYFDQDADDSKMIPAGTIMTFENKWYRSILYKNTGSDTITANKIEFTSQLQPVVDTFAKTPDSPIVQFIKLLFARGV